MRRSIMQKYRSMLLVLLVVSFISTCMYLLLYPGKLRQTRTKGSRNLAEDVSGLNIKGIRSDPAKFGRSGHPDVHQSHMKTTLGPDFPASDDRNGWSFKSTVDCPRWEKLIDSNTTDDDVTSREQHVPACDTASVTVNVEMRNNTNIPTFNYSDSCLATLVHKYCYDGYIVPKVVHYIWFGRREMGLYHFLSFWSAHKILKPCFIFVHSNYLPFGKYWNFLLEHVPNLIHINKTQPMYIYGKKIKFVEHSADWARMEAVRDFGGIYIDTDSVILRPFEPLRRYNFTMSRAFTSNLSNGILVSAKNATFLKYWFEAYKEYNPNAWGNHSTIVPWKLSKIHGEHIHIEQFTFLNPNAVDAKKWIFRANFNWEKNYAIHLFIRYNKTVHDFSDIRTLNTTVGSVARFTLFGNKELCKE